MTHLAGFINPKGHWVRNGNSVGVGGRREGVRKSDTVNVSEILALSSYMDAVAEIQT